MQKLLPKGLKKVLLPLQRWLAAIVREAIAAELERVETDILLKLAEYYADLKQTPSQIKQQLLNDFELLLQRSLAKAFKSKLL